MFSKATANFVRQIDPEGQLIHVSRINDSRKLLPSALVVKRSRFWFWQRPKYQTTDFNLGQLLLGEQLPSPGVTESPFAKYQGTFGDNVSGSIDVEAGIASGRVKGQGSSNLRLNFGQLRKDEVDVDELVRHSKSRLVDMQHELVQQLEKNIEVLAIVKERVLTTSTCSVKQTKKEHCTLQGVLHMLGLLGVLGSSVNVCVKDSNDIEINSNISLEIPADTVIAYSILELQIEKDGHYAICLHPSKIGKVASDSDFPWPSQDGLNVVDGQCNGSAVHGLSALEELPPATRRAFFHKLQEILRDLPVLSCLQSVLEEFCSGEAPDVAKRQSELAENQRKLLSEVLELLGLGDGPELLRGEALKAAHQLVSALEELPDETLSILSGSCPDFLEALDMMLRGSERSSHLLCVRSLPGPPQENRTQAFQLAQWLLATVGVALKRDGDGAWEETGSRGGVRRLILHLAVHGLWLLSHGQN